MKVTRLSLVLIVLLTIPASRNEAQQDELFEVDWHFMPMDKIQERKFGSQIIQDYFGWHVLSGVGVVGTFTNLFLLHCFYAERAVLATSVNAMICMGTLHKAIYSTIIVHWRNYSMVTGRPVMQSWLGKENVRT